MNAIQCVIAQTQQQLDDALRVRFQVFGQEMGLLGPGERVIRREVDAFDTLNSTVHFVAYVDREPVATARLLLPNDEVARENGLRIGLGFEFRFDLGAIVTPGLVLAETTRLCVLRGFRGGTALARVYAEMYRESRRRGVTHWAACANTETDSTEDALIAYQLAEGKGLTSQHFHVEPTESAPAPASPRSPLYTADERRRAGQGDLEGIRLPRTLALFARKMGARYIGRPTYDPRFHSYSMPLILPLDDEQWLHACSRGEPEAAFHLSA